MFSLNMEHAQDAEMCENYEEVLLSVPRRFFPRVSNWLW